MNYIKVILGICCFFIIVICTFYGIGNFVGSFIMDLELKVLVSFLGMIMVLGGYYRFENKWRHYR